MLTVEELKESVSRNDHEGFLRVYIVLILQGTTLTLPKSRLQEQLIIEWKDCIPSIAQFYTDSFIEKLSHLWLELLVEQGDSSSDRFLEELLTILNNKIKKAPKKEAATPLLNEVSLKVSDDYYKDKKARESKLLPVDQLLIKVNEMLKRERTDLFLIAYLGVIIQDTRYKVPKVTIPEKIKIQWKRIISHQLKYTPNQAFIDRLSSKWFFILNKKGIPSNQEKVKEILYFIKANAKEDTPTQEKPSLKKNFIKNLFSKG